MRSSRVGSPLLAPISKLQQFPLGGDPRESDVLQDSGFLIPFYEPTSVLDPHLSSSPAASDNLLRQIPSLPPSCWEDPPPSSSEDWDLVTWFLGGSGGDKDEPPPPPSFRPLHQFLDNQPSSPLPPLPLYDAFELNKMPCYDPAAPVPLVSPPSNGAASFNSYLVQLIRAAQAVESNDAATARAILARLHQPLSAAAAAGGGRPVQRVACYFLEALQSLLNQEPHGVGEARPSPVEMVHKITAYKAFSDLSPVLHFASFTANQAVLEALDRSRSIHLIDFDVGLGGQWSSFLHEVAERWRAAAPPSIRITGIIREESLETRLSAENLRDFARGLGLEFSAEFVRVGSMGFSALGALRLAPGDSVAVSLTPSSFRLFGGTKDTAAQLLRFISHVSPRVTVFVDTESSCRSSSSSSSSSPFCGLPPAPQRSFRRCFAAGLENSSALLDHLDSAAAAAGVEGEQLCRIEQFLVKPQVLASLSVSLSFGGAPPWREMFEAAAMKPVPFSGFTEAQAELLSKRSPVAGFQVERRDWSMVLSWRGKEVASTSAWQCC